MNTSNKSSADHTILDARYRWDLESLFVDINPWFAEGNEILSCAERFSGYAGTLGRSGDHLLSVLKELCGLYERLSRFNEYAYLRHHADFTDPEAAALMQRAGSVSAEVRTATSFLSPEILSIGWQKIEEMTENTEGLSLFRQYLGEIERNRPHTQSPEVESAISQLSELGSAASRIRDAIHDADMRFDPITHGSEVREVSHGSIHELLQHPDRAVRRAAYVSYTDGYLRNRHSFGATINWQASSSLAFARARRFQSVFESALFKDPLPPAVFHTAVRACRAHYPLFRRYFKARARILKVDTLSEFDLFAPLSKNPPSIPYEQGVTLVLESLAPLGEEYVRIAERGIRKERWVDVFPAPGKASNAFSAGAYGSRPFFLLNYAPTMPEVGTLAHELGHSVHTYLTNCTQPFCYSSYGMTVAETASNLNQVLLRERVLRDANRDTSLAVLDEAFYFAHRYLFVMPTLSRVEHVMHSLYSRGRTLSGADISKATVSAFGRAYGDAVQYEDERLGIKWAEFCHLYVPYYTFQYSVGISAAMAIGRRIIAGDRNVRDRYLEFLSLGSSRSPVDLFKVVGIDITSPTTYEDAFRVVEGYVERLEVLV